MSRLARAGSTMLLSLVLLATTGCAADSGAPTDGEAALQLLARADVEQTAPDSPQRAVLQWWRAMQFKDGRALDLFTSDVAQRISSGFEEELYRDFGPWLQYSHPRVLDVERKGMQATVYLRVDQNQVVSPKITKHSREYVALSLRRVGGRWRLSDPTFFEQNSTRLRKDRLDAERRASTR